MIEQPKRRRTWLELGLVALFFLLVTLFIAMLAFVNTADGAEDDAPPEPLIVVKRRAKELCGIDARGRGYLKGTLTECITEMLVVIRLTSAERDVASGQARACEKRAR